MSDQTWNRRAALARYFSPPRLSVVLKRGRQCVEFETFTEADIKFLKVLIDSVLRY